MTAYESRNEWQQSYVKLFKASHGLAALGGVGYGFQLSMSAIEVAESDGGVWMDIEPALFVGSMVVSFSVMWLSFVVQARGVRDE